MAQATATLIYELPTGGTLTASLDLEDPYPDAISDLATRCVNMMADALERVAADDRAVGEQ